MTDEEALVAVAAAIEAGDTERLNQLQAALDAEDAERRARLERPEALAQSALWYAEHGIAVFPLRPGSKVPITANGFKAATTERDQVARWWSQVPQANIGLPTGLTFDVIDVDGPEGCLAISPYIEQIRQESIGLVSTPRPGGLHWYMPPTEGRGNKAGLLPKVDYRGLGGYVVAPPSINEDADRWTWVRPIRCTQPAAR